MTSATAVRSKLVIDLDEGEESQALQTLRQMDSAARKNITKVRVESSWEDTEDWIDAANIFENIGRLKNLEQLHFNLSCKNLPMALLAQLLEQLPRLQMLCLDSVILSLLTEEDSELLGQAVKGHESLACVCLSDIQLKGKQADPTANAEQALSLEPFLVSLVQDCPKMRVLELEDVPTSAAALQAIGSSSQLRDVELWNIPTVGEHVEGLASALQTNSTLEKLEACNCSIGPLGGQQLTKMLLNNRGLTSAVLDIDWGVHTMFGHPIASILRSNQTLRRLHFVCRQQEEIITQSTPNPERYSAEDYAQVICSSLVQNSALQQLAIEFRQSRTSRNDNSRLAVAFADPLKSALQQNFTLQDFALMGGGSILPVLWGPEVAFPLALNKAGRRVWMQSNRDDWIETLLKHKEDLSTTYYLISLHPHWVHAQV